MMTTAATEESVLEATQLPGATGKQSGKTLWSGRRRSTKRKSGFAAKAPVRLREADANVYVAGPKNPLLLTLELPAVARGQWFGVGGYLIAEAGTDVQVRGVPDRYLNLSEIGSGIWTKVGTLIQASEDVCSRTVVIAIRPPVDSQVGIFGFEAGVVEHEHLAQADIKLLGNMHTFAPEANFYVDPSPAVVTSPDEQDPNREVKIWLKSCNRCGRYLPVNLEDERKHLSYSNHCGPSRAPCTHSNFGKLSMEDQSDDLKKLTNGFQMECRFCKKFEVNAALNPQRTAGQMKEDGARRRHFEILLDYLYQGSPQLRYKDIRGTDLAEDVWERFDRGCFKCGKKLTSKAMNLDHTRPLAMLWPLDEHATSLCKDCNGDKRDRAPVDFYSEGELVALAEISKLPLEDLRDPRPNIEALRLLGNNLPWFYEEFLALPQLNKIREGKRTGDLVVKALNRVIANCPDPKPLELLYVRN